MAKRCIIDGRQRSKRSVLARLRRDLQFSVHFGDNLDALFDCLTTDILGPVEIIWRPTETAKASIGQDFERIVATLRDAQLTRDDLRFKLKQRRD